MSDRFEIQQEAEDGFAKIGLGAFAREFADANGLVMGHMDTTWVDHEGRVWHQTDDGEPVEVTDGPLHEFASGLAAMAHPPAASTNYWWLSFCDGDLPAGSQFLGAVMAPGSTLEAAISWTWEHGQNPGGEIAAVGPVAVENIPAAQILERLLSREEIEATDREVG